MLLGARFGRADQSVAQLSRRGRTVRPLTSGAEQEKHATRQRVLVVEDSPVIAPFVTDALTDLGYEVIGPAPNMAVARELIETEEIDAALMDVFIRGERVFALCELLVRKNVPFLLTSGYADWQIPEEWLDRPRLNKPYIIEQLREAVAGLLGAQSA